MRKSSGTCWIFNLSARAIFKRVDTNAEIDRSTSSDIVVEHGLQHTLTGNCMHSLTIASMRLMSMTPTWVNLPALKDRFPVTTVAVMAYH